MTWWTSTSHSQETQFADCGPSLLGSGSHLSLYHSANSRHWTNVVLMLGQDRRLWDGGTTLKHHCLSVSHLLGVAQQTPMLSQCWESAVDGGPPLTQYWVNVGCLLVGIWFSEAYTSKIVNSKWNLAVVGLYPRCTSIIPMHPNNLISFSVPIKTPHPYERRTWIKSLLKIWEFNWTAPPLMQQNSVTDTSRITGAAWSC